MTTDTTAPEPTHARSRAYLRLSGMSWSHFVNDGAANFLPGVLPAILIGMQLPVAWAGTLMTALLVGQGLQPFAGLLGDRIGGRGLSVIGLLGSSIGAGLVGFVATPTTLVAVLILIGVSNAFFHPQAVAGVRRLGDLRQGLAISTFLVGGEIGRGVWPVLASLCLVLGSLHWLALLALPGLLSLYLLYRCAPPLPRRTQHAEPIQWSKHAGPAAAMVAFCALRSFAMYTLITLLPILWVDNGGALTVGASLVTVLMLVGVVGNLTGGWLADRLGSRKLMWATMLLGAVSIAGLTGVSGIWFWLLTAIAGIALFATLPLTVLIAQDLFPENRSFGSGLVIGFANALGAVAVIGIGPMIDFAGPLNTFWLAVAATIIAMLVVFRMPRLAWETAHTNRA